MKRKYLLVGVDCDGYTREVWHECFTVAKADGEAMMRGESAWTAFSIMYGEREVIHQSNPEPTKP